MEPLFKTSKFITFAYKAFIPVFLLIMLSTFYGFDFSNSKFLLLSFAWLVVFSLIQYSVCYVEVYNDYILVTRFFRTKKYEYDKVSNIWELEIISPRMMFISLKGERLLNRIAIAYADVGFKEMLLYRSDPMVTFVQDKIKGIR